MIANLLIKNFQRHKNLSIDLDPQVTVLVGPTDRGKSSVMRAIRWLFFNRAPRDFVRWGKKYAKVEATVNGKTITRKKGRKNQYIVDGKVLSAVGTKLPDEVQASIKVSEENIQRQHDRHFWLTLSPGQVAKELNRIVNLGLIDQVHKNLITKSRQNKNAIELTKERLKTNRERRKEILWVKRAISLVRLIIDRTNTISNLAKRIDRLSVLIDNVKSITTERKDTIKMTPRIEKILSTYDRIENIEEQIVSLEGLLQSIKKEEEELCLVEKKYQSLSERLERQLQTKCPLCGRKRKK